jgi:hypothetical protein
LRRWGIALVVLLSACGLAPDPLPRAPRVFLWAWEHAENLNFVDTRQVGVAFLARSVSWRDGQLEAAGRRQPLEMPAGTSVIGVVRLEAHGGPLPDEEAVVGEILKVAELPRLRAVQVDFDARVSERQWYGEVLNLMRAQMNPALPLTITALASWCLGDPWIRNLPVMDAVPMMFRMGLGDPRDAKEFSLGVCRSSVGVATDEIPPVVPHGRRIFIFHPGSWTAAAYRDAMQMARRLQ